MPSPPSRQWRRRRPQGTRCSCLAMSLQSSFGSCRHCRAELHWRPVHNTPPPDKQHMLWRRLLTHTSRRCTLHMHPHRCRARWYQACRWRERWRLAGKRSQPYTPCKTSAMRPPRRFDSCQPRTPSARSSRQDRTRQQGTRCKPSRCCPTDTCPPRTTRKRSRRRSPRTCPGCTRSAPSRVPSMSCQTGSQHTPSRRCLAGICPARTRRRCARRRLL